MPKAETEGGQTVGRIGIGVRDDPAARAELLVQVQLGPAAALAKAARQTWDTSVFSLRMIGRMMIGELSWRNISGPVTIADYAGQSARLGIDHYLKFLALISISLGVLNLLPIPILDGGHLLYYLVEVIKGGPLSERVMEIGQQIGLGLLVLLDGFCLLQRHQSPHLGLVHEEDSDRRPDRGTAGLSGARLRSLHHQGYSRRRAFSAPKPEPCSATCRSRWAIP